MTPRRGKLSQYVIAPIAALVILAMAVVVAFIWFSATKQDRIAREHSVMAVQQVVTSRLAQIGRVAKDYGWWNDAVENLVLDLDLEWADRGIGFYVYEIHGYEMSFVLDGADRTVYAAIEDGRVAIDAVATLAGGLERLIAEARAAPPRRPEPAVGLLAAGEEIVMVGVSAIAPEEHAAFELPPGPPSLLIYVKRIDQDLLGSIAEALQVRDLRLVGGAEPMPEPLLPLIAPDDSRLGTLVWRAHQPGWHFLRSLAPALAAATAIVALFTWTVLRHARLSAQAIEASEARFRDVADASSDWIWEVDAGLRVRYLSERFVVVTERSPHEVIGRPLDDLLHPAETAERWERYRKDLEHRRPFRNLLCLCEDRQGRTRTLRVAGKPVVDDRGRYLGCRGTATDITAEIDAERRARYLALHDPLTGLPNRQALAARLEEAVASVRRRGEGAAVLCLDLDRFKEVNDSLGHAAGDRLIRRCAERLQACVRDTDTVARIGGDEFAVVQVGLHRAEDAQRLCRRLLDTVATPFDLDGQEVLVAASIGVALIPVDGSIPGRLLQRADIALCRAKAEGRNTFRFFEPEMDARLQERRALERDLRLALARNQLELHYQPKVELRHTDLAGAEALVRWHHPDRGLVPPGDFIGVAEETGLILPLGEWVLRTACAQAAAWFGLTVAVNISPVQFRHPDFIAMVRRALADFDLAPERLELEITEGVLLQNAEAAVTTLQRLKELGVRVAMDDFGTGYSSLSYLHKFPFDKIKIDKSFVRELAQRTDAAAIVRAVVGLGQSLRMQTCAEGVETGQQLAFLKREGCDEGQGYYFGRPVPVAEFERNYAPVPRLGHAAPVALGHGAALAAT